jgi:transcription initiation factor TFIID subunit 2
MAADTMEEDIDALILQEIAETPPAVKPPSPKPTSLPVQTRPTIKLKFNGHSLGLPKKDTKPPKALKPKPASLVPYDDDDGGKDLLEEVLAIEELKEKKTKESRQASSSRKERSVETHRNHEASLGPSRSGQSTPVLKIKKPTNGHTTSVKGKDKEITKPESSPASKHRVPSASTPINEKKCREILKKLYGMDEAYLFRQPVDADLLGCPTYV